MAAKKDEPDPRVTKLSDDVIDLATESSPDNPVDPPEEPAKGKDK